MKRLLFITCLAVLAAAGCKKESTTHNTGLFGKWELRTRDGGWQPTVSFAPGNGNIVQFNADSTYTFYLSGSVSRHGTFQIVEKSSSMTPGKYSFIYYDHTTEGDVMYLKTDTLIIGSSAADGISSLYIKK